MKDMIKKHRFFLIIGLIISFGIILRLLNLQGSFSHDEWYTYDVVARNFTDMNAQMYPDVHVPLYFYLVKIFVTIFGMSELTLRIFSVILGILGLVAFAIFTKKFFANKVAILSTAILSFSVFHIAYSQVARMYSLLFLAIVCSLYFMFELLFQEKKYSLLGYIISNLIIIYTHFFGAFFILFQLIVLFIYQEKLQNKKRIILGHLWMFISMIPFGIFMLIQVYRKIIGTSYADWMPPTTLTDLYVGFSAMSSNHILSIFFLIIFIYFIYKQTKSFKTKTTENIKKNIILIGLFIGLILPSIITLITPIFAWRYYTIIYPLFILMIVIVIQDFNFKKYEKLIWGIIFFLLILSSLTLSFKIQENKLEEQICIQETIQEIRNQEKNNTYFATYRWLNEWVQDHRPITGALPRKQEILEKQLPLINYYNTSLDYVFQNYENLMLVSRSYWHNLYVDVGNLTQIKNNSCSGYHYFIYTK